MTKLLLTHKQAMMAVELGCCIAMGTAEYVIGHAYPGSCGNPLAGHVPYACNNYALQFAPPPADLRTYPGPDGLVYVEALTPDGVTFLSLVEGTLS